MSQESSPQTADPRIPIVVFVVLAFLFSSVFWYFLTTTPAVAANATVLLLYTAGLMWCPALAAVITCLAFRQSLAGFGFGPGKPVWLAAGILIPVAIGLFAFSVAWITGIAPFNTGNAPIVFSFSFVPVFLSVLAFSCFTAAGEEIGWRGFLVPELSRRMGFTGLALLSAAIWALWHFPLIIFGSYHGTGPLWYSLAAFIPSVMGAGIILAWLRLKSGSVWAAVLFHGFWNYFIQIFYPMLTEKTDAGNMMLGEFGWFVAIVYIVLAVIFWHFRDRLPDLPTGAKSS